MTTVVALAVLVSLLGLVDVIRDREPGWWTIGGLAILEIALLVQCVTGLIRLAQTDRAVNGVTFTAYLVGALLVPPAAFVWAATERTRWGTAVIILGGLTAVALEYRLDQIWQNYRLV